MFESHILISSLIVNVFFRVIFYFKISITSRTMHVTKNEHDTNSSDSIVPLGYKVLKYYIYIDCCSCFLFHITTFINIQDMTFFNRRLILLTLTFHLAFGRKQGFL